MNNDRSHERKKARMNSEPLWLIVARDGKSKSYEFPPGSDDTTVVVGSSERAQIRIAGAAPIAFYVERIESDLCITSCYLGSDLYIDGRVVSGRRTIVGRATVELAGVRLVLAVRDNPPTLPGYYVEATPEAARVSATSSPAAVDSSGASSFPPSPDCVSQTELVASAKSVSPTTAPPPRTGSAARGTPALSGSSEKARNAYSDVLDAWFDATFLSDPGAKNAPPKLDEPSAVRTRPGSLKQVSVPPRPPPTVLRPYSDLAETRELAPIRLMAITEELETVELEPASSSSEAPTERAIRVGGTTATPKLDSEPVVTPKSVGTNITTQLPPNVGANITTRLLPSAPPRKRRPLLFLLGAMLGTLLPTLCLVGVGRLAVLSKNAPPSRAHSTYAAATAASLSPLASAVSTTAQPTAPQPNAVTPAISASSASKVPIQVSRFKKRYSSPAASAQ